MIEPIVAVALIAFGVFLALVCTTYGAILHMRYIDRKLLPPAKPHPTQKLPVVRKDTRV